MKVKYQVQAGNGFQAAHALGHRLDDVSQGHVLGQLGADGAVAQLLRELGALPVVQRCHALSAVLRWGGYSVERQSPQLGTTQAGTPRLSSRQAHCQHRAAGRSMEGRSIKSKCRQPAAATKQPSLPALSSLGQPKATEQSPQAEGSRGGLQAGRTCAARPPRAGRRQPETGAAPATYAHSVLHGHCGWCLGGPGHNHLAGACRAAHLCLRPACAARRGPAVRQNAQLARWCHAGRTPALAGPPSLAHIPAFCSSPAAFQPTSQPGTHSEPRALLERCDNR